MQFIESSAGTTLPQHMDPSRAKSSPAADERMMGALGHVLDSSLKLVRTALCSLNHPEQSWAEAMPPSCWLTEFVMHKDICVCNT